MCAFISKQLLFHRRQSSLAFIEKKFISLSSASLCSCEESCENFSCLRETKWKLSRRRRQTWKCANVHGKKNHNKKQKENSIHIRLVLKYAFLLLLLPRFENLLNIKVQYTRLNQHRQKWENAETYDTREHWMRTVMHNMAFVVSVIAFVGVQLFLHVFSMKMNFSLGTESFFLPRLVFLSLRQTLKLTHPRIGCGVFLSVNRKIFTLTYPIQVCFSPRHSLENFPFESGKCVLVARHLRNVRNSVDLNENIFPSDWLVVKGRPRSEFESKKTKNLRLNVQSRWWYLLLSVVHSPFHPGTQWASQWRVKLPRNWKTVCCESWALLLTPILWFLWGGSEQTF